MSNDIMSPYCPGRTLAACPSEQAFALRSKIEDWMREGKTETEIVEKLVSSYGEEVRGASYSGGVAVLLWLTPTFVLAIGAYFLSSYLGNRQTGIKVSETAQNLLDKVKK